MALSVDPTLPAWAVRVIDELNAADRRASDIAGPLSREQLNWKPTEGSWSVGQCLDHLLVANDVYLPPIAEALENRRTAPVESITPGWFGGWFIRNYIEPSPSGGKARAPQKIAPASQVDPSVLERFLQSNDVARNLVRQAGPYDVNRIRFRNPFVPVLRFTIGTGLEIVWRHQRRHLLQAERIKQSPGFPRS